VRVALGLVALVGAAAAADPAPLGRYARPGVPIALRAEGPREVTVGGWTFPLATGVSYVFTPTVPCLVRDRAGRQLWSFEAVPHDVFLLGLVGPRPALLEEQLEPAVGRPVQVETLHAEHLVGSWRAYDLFDLVLVARPATSLTPEVRKALVDWAHAGGRVAVAGRKHAYPGAGGGLGWFGFGADADDLLRAFLRAPRPARPARPAAVRRDLHRRYGRADAEVASAPLDRVRAIVLGAALASAVLLGMGVRVRPNRVLFWSALAGANAAGALLGLLLPGRLYQEEAAGRVEVVLAADGYERVRTYRLFSAVAGAPQVAAAPGWLPVLADREAEPWWADTRRACTLRRGRWRIFLVEDVRTAGPRLEVRTDPVPEVVRREVRAEDLQKGLWDVRVQWRAPPSNASGPAPLVERIDLRRQR
jgi:hypothetical protein